MQYVFGNSPVRPIWDEYIVVETRLPTVHARHVHRVSRVSIRHVSIRFRAFRFAFGIRARAAARSTWTWPSGWFAAFAAHSARECPSLFPYVGPWRDLSSDTRNQCGVSGRMEPLEG